jgi:hypothetical protein
MEIQFVGDGLIFQQGQNVRYYNNWISPLQYINEAIVEVGAPERLTAFGARTFLVISHQK